LSFSVLSQDKGGNFHLDKEYKISPTGSVHLNSSDAKVYITGSSRTTAHVKIDRESTTKGLTFGHEEFSVDVNEENGDLRIREHSSSVSIGVVGYHYEKYTITIEAPEGTNLLVKGDDGDYRIRNINGAISLDLDDADVELIQCSGSKFEFRLDDGDIKMDEGKGRLEIDGDDADIRIRNARFSYVDAKVDDGDLLIETSLDDAGEYRISAQDGLVSFSVSAGGGKFDIHHDDGRVFADTGYKTEEDSEDRTRLTLGNGSAKVDIRADDARVRLTSK
jgi:hypothetical protein